VRVLIPAVAVIYSLIRYAWAKGVDPQNWPAYIGNKALAFCAVGFVAAGLWKMRNSLEEGRGLLKIALWLAIAHALISAVMLQPGYYEYLYAATGKLNGLGEGAIALGALALGFAFTRGRTDWSRKGATILFLVLVLAHIVSVGALKWVDPGRWAYGLVPISLLSALIVTGTLVFAMLRSTEEDR
jgi:hypothetical protein